MLCSDVELCLDLLSSSETDCLEYLLRITKLMLRDPEGLLKCYEWLELQLQLDIDVDIDCVEEKYYGQTARSLRSVLSAPRHSRPVPASTGL